MLTVAEALAAILRRCTVLPAAPRPLAEALGCVLAEDVTADLDLPPFDKALVDGYAVRCADLDQSEPRLRLGEEITAGRTPSRPLGPREAAAIMTGAPLPQGADAVVMIERTRREGDLVVIDDPGLTPGKGRLTRGRELRAGEVVLRCGQRLTAAHLGLLASVGRTMVRTIPSPRVRIIPTGDELVEPGQVPGPGQIRNSNAVMLRALAAQAGAEPEVQAIARDDPQQLQAALALGLTADLLIITGGVSAGRLDLVPTTLERLAVERVFHKVRVKPGKPVWFGQGPARGDAPGPLVFGLPGNPVSGLVGFLLFVRPALDRLSARTDGPVANRQYPLAARFQHSGDRPTYFPVRLQDAEGATALVPLDSAGSADLRAAAEADGFAIFAPGDRTYLEGEIVEFLPLR